MSESSRRQLDDRDASIHLGRVPSVGREGGEDAVSELPESVALGLIVSSCRLTPFAGIGGSLAGFPECPC